MEEYRAFSRFPLQVDDGTFGLGDIRGSDVNGRIVVQEGLFSRARYQWDRQWVQDRKHSTFAVSLPALLFGLVTMTTLPVRSGRLSSFHLGFLSLSESTGWKPEP